MTFRNALPWIALLAGAYEALAVAFFIASGNLGSSLEDAFFWVAALPLIYLIPVAVHEAGHLLVGWITGSKLIEIAVGRITINRKGGKTRLCIRSGGWRHGHVQMLPKGHRLLRPRMFALAAGGPIADGIMFASSILIAYRLWDDRLERLGHGFSIQFLIAGGVAVTALHHLMMLGADEDVYCDATFMRRYLAKYGDSVAACEALHVALYYD